MYPTSRFALWTEFRVDSALDSASGVLFRVTCGPAGCVYQTADNSAVPFLVCDLKHY